MLPCNLYGQCPTLAAAEPHKTYKSSRYFRDDGLLKKVWLQKSRSHESIVTRLNFSEALAQRGLKSSGIPKTRMLFLTLDYIFILFLNT